VLLCTGLQISSLFSCIDGVPGSDALVQTCTGKVLCGLDPIVQSHVCADSGVKVSATDSS
jgi:hypothetical protein